MIMKYKMPLFIVTGASGVGKTTVMQVLRDLMPEFVVFSTDIDNFGTTAAKLEYQDRYNLLLHFAYSVAMSGRGTIIAERLCRGMPKNVTHTINLVNFALLTCIAMIQLAIPAFGIGKIKQCGRMIC